MTDPKTVIARNAVMRIATRTKDLNDVLDQFASLMDDRLAQADAAITNLNNVASTAAAAITASATDRAQLNTRVAALEAIPGLAVGTAATPPIALLGGTADVTVILNRAMTNGTYNTALIISGFAAGKATATVKTRSAGSLVVTLTAAVASVGVGTLTVLAWP